MQYRRLGNTGCEISALGFGTMRLPTTDHAPGSANIDTQEAIRLIRHAIDQGLNYVDTAYNYHGGQSEAVVGEALKDGYREKTYLATKSPVWLFNEPEDFDRHLDEQLSKLRTDHIDFYLLHALNHDTWENKVKKLGLIGRMAAAKAAGKIRFMGFSFHSSVELFKEIVDASDDWDFCQIQYNYMDEHSQAGRKGLHYAASKNLPVIIMEPLRGGKLVGLLPEEAKQLMESYRVKRSPAEWAFRWLWNQPEVTCVLSGMNSLEMVRENVRTASEARAGELTGDDEELLQNVVKAINARIKVGCTGCRYCMPCPKNVDIPGTFAAYNRKYTEGFRAALMEYFMCTAVRKDSSAASNCIECGKCEQHCPQHLEIRRELKNARRELEGPIYKIGRKMVQWLRLYG